MQIHRNWIAVSIAAIVVGAAAPAMGQAPKPLQSQETNIDGITAELTGVTQSDGVLTVRIRFRNAGDKTKRVQIVTHPNDIDKNYVVAGSTKLLPLRDSDKVPLMSALNSGGNIEPELKPGTSYLFWAKFPAPPAGTKKIAIYTVPAPPFEDVAVPGAQ